MDRVFKIAPYVEPPRRPEFEIAGPDNEFATLDEACLAAEDLDVAIPLDVVDGSDDEWCVYEYEPETSRWHNLTRGGYHVAGR